MDSITIRCPHCGYSKTIARDKIPENTKNARCPACKQVFALDAEQAAPPPTPPQVVNATPPQQASPRTLSFEFTGSAKEYFGIWIVNTLLKIVTLGIYSPWAKVRKRRYFYGNTQLETANFDYLADPIALLKGWLIGAALFIVYSLGSRYSPSLGTLFGLLFFLLMPWLIVRSRIFNNRNSAHRNVRFNFRPAYAEAYKVYAGLPLLTVFTAGLLAPYVYYRQKRFLMENNSFGTSSFGFDAQVRDFYLISLKTLGLALLCIGIVAGGTALASAGGLHQQSALAAAGNTMLMVLALLAYLLLGIYSYVRMANLGWNGTHIGGNRFVSCMRVRDMAWIMVSNLFAVACSVGLLMPWASVRLARYRLEKLAVLAVDDIGQFSSAVLDQTSAVGEEIGDIFGIDIGF